jgi:hypothetical protein
VIDRDPYACTGDPAIYDMEALLTVREGKTIYEKAQ